MNWEAIDCGARNVGGKYWAEGDVDVTDLHREESRRNAGKLLRKKIGDDGRRAECGTMTKASEFEDGKVSTQRTRRNTWRAVAVKSDVSGVKRDGRVLEVGEATRAPQGRPEMQRLELGAANAGCEVVVTRDKRVDGGEESSERTGQRIYAAAGWNEKARTIWRARILLRAECVRQWRRECA